LRVRTLRATLCSLTFLGTVVGLAVPVPALAAKKAVSVGTAASASTPSAAAEGSTTATGGSTTTTGASTTTTGGATTTEGSPTSASPTATTAPTVHAPVTARTPKLTYRGPVYEKTATGAIVPYVVPPPAGKINGSTGGSAADLATTAKPDLLVPGSTARYIDGLAAAPLSAPAAVQEIVWAGNQLIGLPYIYGGGHASFSSPGYDCSGTVSFALHGASLISTPMDSSEFMGWGEHGVGRWVTIFTNPEHAYMTVAGLRLDTSPVDDPTNEEGPRWRPLRPGNPGFTVRHPVGL
jgi:cell wall-associated NlpC family hydrolase